MSTRGWRSAVAVALGRLHLLRPAEALLRWGHSLAEAAPNRRFADEHPYFGVPPPRLSFEALGHVSAREYYDSGWSHAALFAALISERVAKPAPTVLEWGCGPGRITRWMREAGLGPEARLIGVDVNGACIEWCRTHVPDALFERCSAQPPLPVPDRSLDAVYSYSVWTHLSEESIEAWSRDMARALVDDGVFIVTCHGDRFADMLLPAEVAVYRGGEPVVHAGFAEGRKRYLSFHPPRFVARLLGRHFEQVTSLSPPAGTDCPQDLWCACRPRR
jgi:SAM-dependent methyltransferase